MKHLAIILGILCCISPLFAQKNIAIVTKVEGDIMIKRASDKVFKNTLKIGTKIQTDDQIKTGQDGRAVVIFLDDKTQLKIQPNSQLQIQGTPQNGGSGISKKVNMDLGKMKAQVAKQRRGDFVIATPTSVASVKGTIFWIFVDPTTGDQVVVETGQVSLTNNSSGSSVTVGANQSGTSHQNGNVDVAFTVTIMAVVQSFNEGTSLTVNNVSLVAGTTPENVSLTGAGSMVIGVSGNTTFENYSGKKPKAGDKVRVTGQLSQQGTFTATVVTLNEESAETNLTIAGVVQQYTPGTSISINNAALVAGPSGVVTEGGQVSISVDESTVIEGNTPISGSNVSVTAVLKADGTILAKKINVDQIVLKITGTIQQYTENTSMTVSIDHVEVSSGSFSDAASFEGTQKDITLSNSTTFEGEEPSAGGKVTVVAILNPDGSLTANSVRVVKESHRLEIEFKNSSGERKTLEIEFE